MLEPTKKDISHMGELASDSENPKKIELIFRFVFQEKPTYEEIKSHTPNIYPIFALQSQKKILPKENLLKILIGSLEPEKLTLLQRCLIGGWSCF